LVFALVCGLGLPAGAVARAQGRDTVVVAKPDSVKKPVAIKPDSIKPDSIKPDSVKRDTIKAGFTRGELPVSADIGRSYRFTRTQLYASGALTLGELLDRIPGASTARTGWLTDVQVTSFAGAMGRVRVFVDGVELDALDPAGGGVQNLGLLQLWPYEDAVVERAGDELRVHLRSWRDNRTAPLTRVDVLTGDREGNVFRGYFAQRFANGGGLQAVFSNASTRDVRSATAGDGSNIGFNVRAGWANGRWSFDGWAHRAGGERRPTSRASGLPTLAGDRPQYTVAYLRAGFRDPDSAGVFGQFIVASLGFRETPASNNLSRLQPTTPDTTVVNLREASRLQYIATTGWRRGAFTTSFTARVRAFDGTTPVSPLVRMGYDTPRLGVSLWAETARPDSARRVDAQVRVMPLTRVALAGAWSSATRTVAGQQVATGAMRAEAAVRLRGSLWVGGGVLSRDSAMSRAALSLDTSYVTQALRPAQGTFVQLRGDLFRDLKVDAWAIAWRDAANQFYLPKVQAHSRLYIESDWTTRFPKRQFGFLGALIHEYRDPVRFPTGTGVQTTGIMRNLSTLVEFRLLNAYVSWRFTNTLRLDFDTAPGYVLPRGVNLYGIRWEFRG
jgi:hypothetical protein